MTALAQRPRIKLDKLPLEASLCRESFYDFVLRFWDVVVTERIVPNWHIEYLCHEAQALAERVFRRRDESTGNWVRLKKLHDMIVNVPPGSTKSTIWTVMLPAWCWINDPTMVVICASYAYALSLYLAGKRRQLVDSEKYHSTFSEVHITTSATGLLANDAGGQFITTSAGTSNITGKHGHMIIVDDPLNPTEAASETQLSRVNDWHDHTLPSRMVDSEITPIVIIMQRLNEDDPTGHTLEKYKKSPELVRHICLPATSDYMIRPRSLRKRYVDGLLDPVRLSRKILAKKKLDLASEYNYAGQYGQSPIPKSGAMFKVDKLEIRHEPPLPREIKRIVRYWDKAGTQAAGCFTVGTKMAWLRDGSFCVMHVERGQWAAEVREATIKRTAISDGKRCPVRVEQEPGSGGLEQANSTVKNLAGFVVSKDRPRGDKEFRADPFAVQMNEGHVWLVEGEWNEDWIKELKFFPFGKYKDQTDSASGAFAYLTTVKKVGMF